MNKLPLNKGTAPQVIRLFDSCFKRGVLHAMEQDDEFGVREWLERHKEAGDFGLVYDDEDFDFRRWRFTIERWAREDRLGAVGDTYLNSIFVRKKNNTYMYAILPMTMRFYMMGVEEWLAYPNPISIELFKHTRKVHWKQVPEHMKVMKTQDFLSILQEFIYERQRMALEGDLSARQYDDFSEAMWKYTRKHDVSDFDETEEDL